MLVRISFLSNSQGRTLEKMLSWVWLNFGNFISNEKVKPVMFMAWFHLLKKMNIVGYRSFITNHFHISFVFRWSTSRIRFLFLLYGWPDARREKRANGKGGWTPPPLEGTDLIRKSFLLLKAVTKQRRFGLKGDLFQCSERSPSLSQQHALINHFLSLWRNVPMWF